MPRPPRTAFADDILHIISRGVARQPILVDGADRDAFASLLRQVVAKYAWRCLTYCLLGNHYHLVVQLREANLSRGMWALNGQYAELFKERHGGSGHVFERRFRAKRVTREEYVLGLLRYVALNPVKARLCERAEDWPWSAHRALLGFEPAGFVDVAAALGHFHQDRDRGRAAYAAFVAASEPSPGRLDARLLELLASEDRRSAIVQAERELGMGIDAIARAFECHPRTVRRHLAALRNGRGEPAA